MRGAVKVIARALYAALVAIVVVGVGYDFGRPADAACKSRFQWVESIEVTSAERHLRPPMLRCVAIVDGAYRNKPVKIAAWQAEDVAAVALVAVPLVLLGRSRRGRNRKFGNVCGPSQDETD